VHGESLAGRVGRALGLLRHPGVSSALAALVVTAALYSGAASLPFFSDDLAQIPWMESLSWSEMLAEPSPFGDHRPLWVIAWRAWGAIAGGLRPLDLHVINLVLHAFAAWLVGLLAAQWAGRRDQASGSPVSGALAAALFASFPFSREAVVWLSAFSYPLSTMLALAAVVAYDQSRRSGSNRWLALSLLAAALAPLAYEAGMVASGLVLLAEGVGRITRRWPRPSRQAGLFLLLLVLQLALWRLVWTEDALLHTLSATDVVDNGAFLVQGLIHPVACIAGAIAPHAAIQAVPLLWALAAAAVALLLWSGRRPGEWQNVLLGLGWFVIASVPALLARKGIADAPRFLYPAAAGVALVWTGAVSGWLRRQAGRVGGVIAVAVVALVGLSSACYVLSGMELYDAAGEVLWQAVDAGRDGSAVLLVNLPMRLTPTGRIYPLGFEGFIPLTPEVTADDLVYVHTGQRGVADAAAFGIALGEARKDYRVEVFGPPLGWEELAAAVRQARSVYLTRYDSQCMRLFEVGGPAAAGAIDDPLARFGEELTLLDMTAVCSGDSRVQVTASWRMERAVAADATVFAHLVDWDGTLVSQADGYPLGGLLPFWLWEAGETMRDERVFPPVEPGEYSVRLGLWELATGVRWPAEGWPDGAVLVPVSCP
jgi:hypothetical protein